MSKKRAVATKATPKKRVHGKRISIKKLIKAIDEDLAIHVLLEEALQHDVARHRGFVLALESTKKFLEARL